MSETERCRKCGEPSDALLCLGDGIYEHCLDSTCIDALCRRVAAAEARVGEEKTRADNWRGRFALLSDQLTMSQQKETEASAQLHAALEALTQANAAIRGLAGASEDADPEDCVQAIAARIVPIDSRDLLWCHAIAVLPIEDMNRVLTAFGELRPDKSSDRRQTKHEAEPTTTTEDQTQ